MMKQFILSMIVLAVVGLNVSDVFTHPVNISINDGSPTNPKTQFDPEDPGTG